MRLPWLLTGICLISLAVHFVIYFFTGASAFINQPSFYYNRFHLKDPGGEVVEHLSLITGFSTYLTAALALGCGSVAAILFFRKRNRPS